jgi:phthalate 4,5-dioxygenase
MLTPDQDQLLTRTGPGTPMGDLFRRYWIPAFLSEELPEPDGAPIRVQLLSERLIAFRDTQGRVGLLDEFCRHRRASLWFGRNESSGLRCAYHGWKYDLTGQCIDIPSEPPGSTFCKDVQVKAYPCIEKGGAVWTYMGPPALRPAFPEFEWAMVPAPHRHVSKRLQECNYLQAMEGGIDSSHVSVLHSGEMHTDVLHKGTRGSTYQKDTRPQFEVVDSPGGLLIGARRNAEAGEYYWRMTQWIMPWYTMIPPYGDHALHGHAWVPIDDENCWTWSMSHHPTRPLSAVEWEAIRSGQSIYAELIPGTYRPVANKDNDYLIDRAGQKSGRYYSGVKGISMQDASIQESMGPITDRSLEYLASTDIAIVKARRRLLEAAQSLTTNSAPPGIDPATHHVRSASLLSRHAHINEAAGDAGLTAKAGTAHVSI